MSTVVVFLQLNYLVPNQDSSKKELSKILEDRDSLRVKVGEMKQERLGLQEKLASANRTMETLRASAPVNQQVTELQVRGECGQYGKREEELVR